ncbi:cation-translocating P-type ATPase [Pseudomonas saliphila]|uniref:cation-translocating P-type ATPase n=1 Tax=Pseudomonas saliphila TaxID=2586906 RepID=UPI0012389306|nr:cation-transporting P-type ATPase [Pseudomonas saliphila]
MESTDKRTRNGADNANWHAVDIEAALGEFDVRTEKGLTDDEAQQRLKRYGPNQLRATESRPWWRILLSQFHSIVIYLLSGAAILAFATGRLPEGFAVLAVLLVNTAIGFVSEWKAVRSMAALRRLGEHMTRVRREGSERDIAAPEIVPGDIVLLEAGDLVPADLRLIEANHLRVNEAPLTGESVPVSKLTDALAADTHIADRKNMLYKGTSLSSGTAVGVAAGTGSETELGRVSALAESAEGTVPPLQQRLDQLGRRLAILTIFIAIAVALLGFLVREQQAALVIETALALGVAAIPEGLPIVATIALARGMYLMAVRNALVNRLTAVETLGATRVIFSDKTGTLTENRMRLQKIVTPTGDLVLEETGPDDKLAETDAVRRIMEVGVLCNGASLGQEQGEDNPRGDPTEIALLKGGKDLGLNRKALLEERPEARVEKFEPRVKKMASFHRANGEFYVAVKGAPEAVLEVCSDIVAADGGTEPLDDEMRRQWLERANQLAAEGLRLLAMAEKRVTTKDAEPYNELCFLGLVGLLDPPRKTVREAIDACQAAGIRVAMVTGDQLETATAIARAVGIAGGEDDPETVGMLGRDIGSPDDPNRPENIYRANIFARVSPEQKLDLVSIYQARGEIVAMTGDGINDAPALKKADIGIAMGKRGTEAAKQVADMVLKDDAFETIVAAVRQGRVIFDNIRKSVIFMLTTNVAEVLAVALATGAGWPLPLLPLQILYLNVLTDVFPALALGVGPASGSEMQDKPRSPQESVLTRAHWTEICGFSAILAACVLGALLLGQHWLGLTDLEAVTVSFLTLAFGKLWFTFVLRNPRSGIVRNEITRNLWVWAALLLCIALLAAAVYLPLLSNLLQTQPLGWGPWALILGMSAIPFLVGQALREIQRRSLRQAP